MPGLAKHETFSIFAPGPVPDRFRADLAEAHEDGRRHPFSAILGHGGVKRGVERRVVKNFIRRAGSCDGARNAYWAVFYHAVADRHKHHRLAWVWECLSQQQLAKAMARLSQDDIHAIWQTRVSGDTASVRWYRACAGALAVARAAYAFIPHGGRLYLPHPAEDVRGKIDLIYCLPGPHEGGFCIQVKSRMGMEGAEAVLVGRELAVSDESGYFQKMLEGVRSFSCHHPGHWRPILLTIGHQPEPCLPYQARGLPAVERCVSRMLGL